MNKAGYAWLIFRALSELARYEVINALGGFGYVKRELSEQSPVGQLGKLRAGCQPAPQRVSNPLQDFILPHMEKAICDAVLLATCLYWKPVLCLQRSVCAVRLLRKYGVAAKLVIGYRPTPFFSHAWVEVDGRVVNSSAAYKSRLRVLCTV